MKKFMMMVAMAFATLTASAQAEVGTLTLKPLVGMNLAKITEGENKMKVGVAAGAELEYMLSDNASISAGAIYSMQGCKIKNSDVKYNLDYINIPILANYYVAKGFAVKAGIQPAFKVSSKIKGGGESADIKGLKSFDLAIPLGLSYEISNFVIDARYNLSLTKIADDFTEEGVKYEYGKNQVIQITLGYKFAL